MKPSTYLSNLQLSTNWRAQYNPLRGLTIQLLVAMLEQGERGNYARLQWLYRFVEKRNSTLRAVLQRRQAAMTRLDWDIRVRTDAGTNPRTLAARQAAFLRDAYERIENLREAITFLALADFRGYAHLERHFDTQGRVTKLAPVPQWFWARLGPDAPWQYNALARPGLPMPQDPVLDPDLFIVREMDSPIDEVAVIAHVRQSLSQKDWDGFVETYGLPPLFLELPADITEASAVLISEIFQRQFDAPLLARAFPGQPQLAYFQLAMTREIDPADAIAQALSLAKAGYEIDVAELSEKTGYRLKLRDYALTPLPKPPAPQNPEADPVEEDI